ncbi:MAG: branched-chain amino acid ABC transporter permease, partial [Ilumatobacteraceae bacterium]
FGLSLEAVREHPEVASSIGINADHIRRIAFVSSGALGGLAGVLHSQLLQYISPDTFYLHLAFLTLAAVVLGGPLHWFGSIVGTFVFALIPEILRPLMGDTRDIGYGLILIAIMLFARRGLIDPRQLGRLSSRIRKVRKVVS